MTSKANPLSHELVDACATGYLAEVQRQLVYFDSSSRRARDSLTPLLNKAAENSHVDVVQFLLWKGATVDRETIRLAIVRASSVAILQLLLSAGAVTVDMDLGLQGKPLLLAIESNRPEFVAFLLEQGADPNPFHIFRRYSALSRATRLPSTQIAGMLIDHGTRIDDSGALPCAAGEGNIDMVRFLIQRGADVNANLNTRASLHWCEQQMEWLPLHKAVSGGHADIVRLLLYSGADPMLPEISRKTPMMTARELQNVEVVDILRQYGAMQ
jgi:ankyrin repeat protein